MPSSVCLLTLGLKVAEVSSSMDSLSEEILEGYFLQTIFLTREINLSRTAGRFLVSIEFTSRSPHTVFAG